MIFNKQLSIAGLFLFIFCYASAQELGFREDQLTNGNFDNRYASYNKSGTKIVFESNRDGHWQIYVMDINGNAQKRLTNSISNDRRPTWHPSKDIILFESDRSGTNELYTLNLETNSVSKIKLPLNGNKSFAAYAPNGVEVIFVHEKKLNDSDIYVASKKGKKVKKLIDDAYSNLYPQFTSRGDVIVYFSNKNIENENNVIYVYNLLNKEKSRLTYFKDQSNFPVWSNNTRRIAYAAAIDDNPSEIYVMLNDGDNKQQITFNNVPDTLPNWSPNDINLLITGFRNGNYHICKILLKEPIEP